MSLQPAEIAALALRLCAARYLDDDCCPAEDADGLALVAAARGVVEGAASGAELNVTSCNDITLYLASQAEKLAALPRKNAGPDAAAMVSGAAHLLSTTGDDIRPEETGDGPATTGESGAPCRCGVLGLAAEVETRVRQLFETQVHLSFGVEPAVTYVTALTNRGCDFAPFCIDGSASLWRSPRTVTLVLMAKSITSRDLWHIAYTLHHELVCHAFQAATATGRLQDPHPRCHWSEGWMDTLVFDLVTEWEDAPRSWLPLRGESAKGEIRRFHDHRYRRQAILSETDVKLRRLARDAYRKLEKTLFIHEIAATSEEARDIVRHFSLAANAQAECGRLKTLGTKLRILLLSVARPEAGVTAARDCLAFTGDHDLGKLEQAIDAASV